jgi:hypothetical protein
VQLHGTKAIRTHIDSADEQGTISLAVFQALRAEWGDRLILQAVSLVSLDYFLTPAGEKLALLFSSLFFRRALPYGNGFALRVESGSFKKNIFN